MHPRNIRRLLRECGSRGRVSRTEGHLSMKRIEGNETLHSTKEFICEGSRSVEMQFFSMKVNLTFIS